MTTFSIRRKPSFASLNLLSLNLKYRGILCYSIKFKYIFVLNLIILRKDIIVYILLVNETMYLNLIEKLNILHLNFAINIMRNLLLKRKASFTLGIIIENPHEVWPVYALPTRGSKLITLPT